MPASVHAAGARSLALKVRPWDGMGTAAEVELVRQQYASLIGADADDVALTPSTGFAITLAAYNVGRSAGVRRGMTVLVLADQMASNVYPWQHICQEHGLKLVVVEEPDDGNWTAAVLPLIIPGTTTAVAVPPCHWCTGATLDLVAIGAKCRG